MNSKEFFDSVNEIFNKVQTPYTCREDFRIDVEGVAVVYERWKDEEDIVEFTVNNKPHLDFITPQFKKDFPTFYYKFYCITKPIFEHLKQKT
jgi:hypothetical protein